MMFQDLDTNGLLPFWRTIAEHLRRVIRSRAWRDTSHPAGCA